MHCVISSLLYLYDFWDWSFGRITNISSFSSCWAYCRCFVLFFISSVLQIFSLHWLSSIQRLAQSDSYIKGNILYNEIQKNLKHVMTCGHSHIVVDCTMGLSNAWIWTIVVAVRIQNVWKSKSQNFALFRPKWKIQFWQEMKDYQKFNFGRHHSTKSCECGWLAKKLKRLISIMALFPCKE